jgi:hypothetical protein
MKMGTREIMANTTRSARDDQDQVPEVEVICCRVLPAWMATNEGGATPEI